MQFPGFSILVLFAAGLSLEFAPLVCGQGLATNWPTISATASSTAPGWPASNACDGDAGTAWASAAHANAFNSEALAYWMDATHPVNYLKLAPLTLNGSAVGIPVSFHVQAASGTNWNLVASFAHVSSPAGGAPVIVRLPATVNTNGLRIVADVLGDDLAGNYSFAVAEVAAGFDPSAVTLAQVVAAPSASSVASPDWAASNATDGNSATVWSSSAHAAASATEWLQCGFNGGGHATVNYVKLRPRFSGRALGFPVDFVISYYDGSKWTTALTNTGFPNPTADEWVILPIAAVDAYQIKITATQLGSDGDRNSVGNYVFQLAELGAGFDAGFQQFALLGNCADAVPTGATDLVSASASASSAVGPDWAASNATDGNPATLWSSAGHGTTAVATEWIQFGFNGGAHASVNYLKLRPRFDATLGALCFPVNFTVAYSPDNGTTWTTILTQSAYPKPTTDNWAVVALPTVDAYQIKVTATTLGSDNNGNCYFQLAEIAAGFDSGPQQPTLLGNSLTGDNVEIRNVGSDAFTTKTQLGNWVYDTRNPIVMPGTGNNIYAPSVVRTGSGWNIYFGGWDAVATHDQLSMTTSTDDFLSFGSHSLLLANGDFNHVNNLCVVQTATNQWNLMCTVLPNSPVLNKPMVATSSNGTTWTPSAGTASALINMSGYTDASNAAWTAADVNGGNHFLYENGVYHMFFDDFKNLKVHYATSTDFKNFTYQGVALNESKICNDVKKFTYGGKSNYLWAYHHNGSHVWYSTGTAIASPSASKVLFSSNGTADTYITSPCCVTDGTRLYGALYGAGSVSTLDHNRIFAMWLQKKVVFTTTGGTTLGSSGNQAYGPDRQQFATSSIQNVGTGSFSVYDTDGVSLLFVSPLVTLRKGDVWQYLGQASAWEPPPPAATSYTTWMDGFPVADTSPGADPDGDGIPNLVEFVLNGNPGRFDAASLHALDSSGANFVYTLVRRVDSLSCTTQVFQYGDDLLTWTDLPLVAGPMVALATPVGGLQAVTIAIPKTAAASIFGRLKVILNQ